MIEEGRTENKVGRFSVMTNAVNFIGGVSFPSIPFAVAESGLIGGLSLMILVAILNEASHRLIVESSIFHRKLRWYDIHSYEGLVVIPFGKAGETVLIFSVFVVAFGACVEFTIMVKDLVPVLLGHYVSFSDAYLVIATWLIFIVPLTLIKDISALAYVSGISIALSALLAAVIITTAPFKQNVADHGGLWKVTQDYGFRSHTFTTISIFTEVFAWQHGIFQFVNSLRHASMRRWRFVTSRVNALIAIIYLIVSVPAYLGYLDDTAGDLFLNLPHEGQGSTLTNIARVCFLFICVMTYPLEMLIVRDVVTSICRGSEDSFKEYTDRKPTSSSSIFDLFLSGRELLTVLILDAIALIAGLLLHDLGDACALVGALGGSLICFIIPGMVYLGVNGDEVISWTNAMIGDEREHVTNNTYTTNSEPILSDSSKPLWFYLLGFPLWCRIATMGNKGVEKKLSETPSLPTIASFGSYDDDQSIFSYISTAPSYDGSIVSDSFFSCLDYSEGLCSTPRGRKTSKMKFIISILLIIFGCVNLFASLLERFDSG